MSIEEILEALRAIVDGAEGRDLTDEEAERYENLETQLAVARRSHEIRGRQNAYQTPNASNLAAVAHVATARPDDTLDRAFESYLRTGQGNQDLVQLRAQGEGVSADGGYTVPSGFRNKLVEVRKAFGGLAEAVETFTTADGRPLEYPSLDDTGNSGSITAEHAAVADGADLTFGTVAFGAYKYTSAGAGTNLPLRVSVELLQDSEFDIAAMVARALGTRIARAQAVHWVTGTGVGQPKGLVASSLTSDRDLDTADTPDYEDLVDLQDLLDAAYEQNASWVMKKNTWSQLRLIVDTNGRPIIQDSTTGISGVPDRRLLGAPVIIDEAMPTLSSAADTYPIAYGDFREAYAIRRVSDLTVFVDPYSRGKFGEVEYTAFERADGNIQNRSAYVILQNNT